MEAYLKFNGGRAVNSTKKFMKNVILTHKELQMSIFSAVADAVCNTFRMPKGYFLTWSHNSHSCAFELWKSATAPENGDAERLFMYDDINKGDYQMNDIRTAVTIAYIRSHAQKFLDQVETWFKEKHQAEFTKSGLGENKA